MKNYIVQRGHYNGKNFEFDTKEEAIKVADNNQKTRKSEVVVLEKCGETEKEFIYKECYRAKGGSLSIYKQAFLK